MTTPEPQKTPQEDTRPLVFLDFDGVLNQPETWVLEPPQSLDLDKVARLSLLCEQLDADVVISSSWRYIHELDEMKDFLSRRGFATPARIIDVTPLTKDRLRRGEEVSEYLTALPCRRHFVILDDLGLEEFEGLERHLVSTDGACGLTDRDCDLAQRVISAQAAKARGA